MKAIPFDPKVTRFVPKMIPSQNSQYRQIKEIRMLSNEFATYNKAKNAPSSLTESMWMANYFALSALNYDKHGKEFFDNFKVHTVVDLRPYLGYKPDFLSCYHCAHIAPGVSQIKSNDKIADVGKKIKNDLQRLLKEGYQYSTLKAETSGPLYYGINGSLSQIGRLELKRPIIDAHISIRLDASKQQSPEKCIGTLGMFSWSVSSPEPSKNHFVTQIGYSGNELPEEDVNKSTKRIEYFLKNISHQQTIKEVFDIIKKVE